MLISMTGYGRGVWQGENSQLQVELRSVNGRYLNLRFKMPDLLLRFEPLLESRLKEKIGRGSVTCQVQWKRESADTNFDSEKLLKVWKELSTLSKANNIEGEISLSQLALMPELNNGSETDIFDKTTVKSLEEGLGLSLESAIEEINQMREREGGALKKQMLLFSEELKNLSEKINVLAPDLSKKQQAKFIERLKKMETNVEVNEADISRELALLADRCDISEEITRLYSHLEQLDSSLEAGGLVGRKLDFVLQEINREINTMGSKSSDSELSHMVVEMKTVAEKIREQVQNIE
jgi:uncharacterized protein (TIGR00255 family)